MTNETQCVVAVPGMRCVWDQGTCRRRQESAVAEDVCDVSGRKLLPEMSGKMSVVLQCNGEACHN